MGYRDGGYGGPPRRDNYGQAPKRNFNLRFRREGYGYQRQGSKGRGGRGRGYGNQYRQNNFRRNQGVSGAKRTWNDDSYQSSKRQRTTYSILPLSTIILAKPGDKTGSVPELVFSGFYDCHREAKFGRNKHHLQLHISRKNKVGRRQDDRVSIPVPLENIEGLAVLTGTNPFEEMMQAYTDRDSIKETIKNLEKEIERRTEAYNKKEEELNALPEIEELPEEEIEEPVEEAAPAEKLPEALPVVEGMEVETAETADLPQVEDAEAVAQEDTEEEKAKQRKKLERKQARERARFEREQQIAKRTRLAAAVEKLAERVEEAQQSLGEKQDKLTELNQRFEDQLRWFDDETEGAEDVFLDELRDGMAEIVDEEAMAVEEPVVAAQPEPVEAAETEQLLPPAEGVEPVAEVAPEAAAPVAEAPVLPVGEEAVVDGLQMEQQAVLPEVTDLTGDDPVPVAPVEEVPVAVPEVPEFEKITEKPMRMIITLKQPLDKFYASNARTDICQKEVIENTSMIILEYGSKQGMEEHFKQLNDALEGPWKDIRRKPEKLLNTPYSAEKTMQYLLKVHKRKEISDNIIEKCKLCGNMLKRMVMEKHLKIYCLMREEACKYCGKVLIFKDMKEHHLKDCPKYIVPCPQRCFERNLERCMVEAHLKVCINSIVECRFKPYGCKVKVKRKALRNHMYDDVAGHLDHLEGRLQLLTNYLMMQDPGLEAALTPAPVPVCRPCPENYKEEEEEEKPEGDKPEEMQVDAAEDETPAQPETTAQVEAEVEK